MRYLLDTNILSDLVRNPQGRVGTYIGSVGEAQGASLRELAPLIRQS